MPSVTIDPPLRFGRFEISPAERVLRVDGVPAALGARAFDLLLALVERRERLVSREELLGLVWPGVVVEEHNITAQISSLRKVLGPQAIATVPGRGYRFVALPDAPQPPERAELAANPAASHGFPEPRTRFIGREAALADLEQLLSQARLLTLTGIGGCGKTRLALQLARRQRHAFADGVCFVDLAPLTDSQRVASACAAALGLGTQPDPPPMQRLAAFAAERQALIVLDNCEQVRDGVAALVDGLLARPGPSRVLATSRAALAVAGEQLYPVRPLSLPATPDLQHVLGCEAVRVFADRARSTWPEFSVDAANAGAVAEICRQLDGIALAIELAAARVPMLSVFDIAARLHDRFRLLTGGSAAVARQQTLAAAMQWSHDLLAPAEQRLLCRMSVFAGGWTLQAATAVAQAADEYEALALLTTLHDRSLVVVDRREGGGVRYRMLETMRQYAQARLDESGEADAARACHAEHFLALAEGAAPHLRGPQQSVWMARLRDEQENLVAAMAWCALEQAPVNPQWGLRLAAATARYWLFYEVELGCRLAQGALERDRDGADSAARCLALLGLASMCMHRGLGEAGLPHARAALGMARRLGVPEWQAMALCGIGSCLSRADEDEAALQHYAQAREIAQASGSAGPLSSALNNIAVIDFQHGRLAQAEQGFRQALHLSRGSGDIRAALIFLHNLVRVLVAARRHADALVCAVEAEALLRGVGEAALKLELLEVTAGLASSQGDHAFAARLWGSTRQRFADAGYQRPTADEAQLVRLSADSRRALGDTAFEAAEAQGRTLDIDAAMLELRDWLERGA